MRTPTYIIVKKALLKEDGKSKQLTAKTLAKALGAETDSDVMLVELLMNSMVGEGKFCASEDGKYYIPTGTKTLYLVTHDEDKDEYTLTSKIFEKEQIKDAQDKEGYQTSPGNAIRDEKRILRGLLETACNQLDELVKG